MKKLMFSCWLWLLPTLSWAALNDTGIKTCSNGSQNGLPCPVAGFPGQDAEFGDNAFNFTKIDANGNAMSVAATNHTCVQDNVTGIMWEVKTDDGGLRDKDWTYTWYDSNSTDGNLGTSSGGSCVTTGRCDTEKFVADVNAQGLCGHNDWRLPNPQELASIVDYSIPYPGSTIDEDLFPNSVSNWFWTNSPYAASSSYSWIVGFYDGGVYYDYRYGSVAVRVARAGQWLLPFSFTDQGDGTVKDNNTGLTWAKCAEGQSGTDCSGNTTTMTWQQALQAADSSTLAGYTDWRLPNVKELQMLVDYTKYSPSISAAYFPNTSSTWFWTSSSYAYYPDVSWIVIFSDGAVYYSYRYLSYAVRVARTGQWLLSFSLNVTKVGNGSGTVTSNPTGVACGTVCAANFPTNTTVVLTATPTTGSVFASWSGDADCSDGIVTLTANTNCAATFNLLLPTAPTNLQAIVASTTQINLTWTDNSANETGFKIERKTGVTGTWAQIATVAANVSSYRNTGLTAATLYYYRIRSYNSAGNSSYSNAISATTLAGIPTAVTTAATAITTTSATLNGSVVSGSATATVSFDFGPTTAYGTTSAATPAQVYSASAVAVSATKTALTCGTTYHFRTQAVNSAGTSYGLDQSFTTSACIVNGVCGTANGGTFTTAPTTNLCNSGIATAVTGTGPWNWNCSGINGGTTASCAANIATYTVNATAGSAGTVSPGTQTVKHNAKATFTVTPNTGYNRNSAVTSTCPAGSWSGNVWTTGAITASCTVSFSFTLIPVPVNGVCGTANGGTFATAPTTNLCATGTASAVSDTGPWTWNCAGKNGGTTANCAANLANSGQYTVTPSVGANGTISPNTPQTVANGALKSFTVTPSVGYIKDFVVGGTCPQGSWNEGSRWTTGPITANCSVIFNFTESPTAWLSPTNPYATVSGKLTLDLRVDSYGSPINSYNFNVNFDPTKLRIDSTFQDAAGTCQSGVCRGANALSNISANVDVVTGKIALIGFDNQGVAQSNNLDLVKIHFLAMPNPAVTSVTLTLVNLLTNGVSQNIGNGITSNALVTVQRYKCGDANGDSLVNIVDALSIARQIIGLPPPPSITPVADVNGNGEISIVDAMHIARYSVGFTVVETCLM